MGYRSDVTICVSGDELTLATYRGAYIQRMLELKDTHGVPLFDHSVMKEGDDYVGKLTLNGADSEWVIELQDRKWYDSYAPVIEVHKI